MPTFPNAATLAKVLPKPANAPRMVNFTGVPEGMGGNQYYGLGLGGIDEQRQKLAELAGSDAGLAQVHEPFGGAGYVLGKLGNVMRENQAMSAEKATRDTLAGVIGGIDPTKGPTMEQIQAAFQADPAYGTKLYEQLIAMQGKEHWITDPTDPNRQINTVNGEVKTKGDTSGGPSDLSALGSIQTRIANLGSFKNLEQATPIWGSVVDAMGRDTPQADLNIIIGMAKLFDPTSVVRTQEGEQVQQTAGLPTELFSYYKYLTGDPTARLDKTTREQLVNEGYSRMRGYYDQWSKDRQGYADFAARHGIDPKDLLLDNFTEPQPYKPPAPPDLSDPKTWQPTKSGKNATMGKDGLPDFTGMSADEIKEWGAANGLKMD